MTQDADRILSEYQAATLKCSEDMLIYGQTLSRMWKDNDGNVHLDRLDPSEWGKYMPSVDQQGKPNA